MPRPHPLLVLATLVPATLLGAGCGSLSRSAPEVRAYVVRAERPSDDAPAEPAAERPTLEVRRLRISPRYDTRSFVYRVSAHGYESDFYHEFFASPADLLTEETRRWLDGSGLFAHVVGPESRVLGGLVLEGRIVALYGDYAGPEPRAVVELQFLLVAEPGSVVQGSFTERAEIPFGASGGADALAEAFGEALARVLGRVEEGLSGALDRSGS